MKKYKVVLLTRPEIHHLLYAMYGRDGQYYGNRPQYFRRHERIIKTLRHHIAASKEGAK